MNDTEFKLWVLDVLRRQRAFFDSGRTRDICFRKDMLLALRSSIRRHEKALYDAFMEDLHKSEYEAYLTEISFVQNEINLHLKNIYNWSKPKGISTPLQLLPSKCKIVTEPLGVALIVAPWNYPFQLIMNPLIGAISSGCCAVLKNSDYIPNIARVITLIIRDCFAEDYICIFNGGREKNEILFNERFDIIFFTGSPALGKIVMTAAAQTLTPVVLELGGKSPCIVDADADIDIAARRIVWGKTLNSGQTCIAPDYLFIHESVKTEFIYKVKFYIAKYFGEDPQLSPDYARIVNIKAFDRLTSYLKEGNVLAGGNFDVNDLYIEPTIIEGMNINSVVMTEEIFGPILPIMTFTDIKEVIQFIKDREKPLALYYFTSDSDKAEYMIKNTSSGGACINDVLVQISNHIAPFGGVGNSGMGMYHGKYSFYAFSHKKSVVISKTSIDIPLKYAPFRGKLKWLKRFI